MKKKTLYPLKFEPIFKEKIWGGNKLKSLLGKEKSVVGTGESWEISDVAGATSIVVNGTLQGTGLRKLIEMYRETLVGTKIFKTFGNRFPLLIKFIDAKENLSVQLHPDDFVAKQRHDSFGKTEMWYVMQADKDSEIILGFKEEVERETYAKHLKEKTLSEILNFEKVKTGDVFFIEPGMIHAIGSGVLLAEIQQTSDVTYRVYDWDRKDIHGNTRELHTELAEAIIDFSKTKDFKVPYTPKENGRVTLVKNKYFKTNLFSISRKLAMDYSKLDSFVIYMCVEGSVEISVTKYSNTLKKGETLLVPACFDKVVLKGRGELLEVSA